MICIWYVDKNQSLFLKLGQRAGKTHQLSYQTVIYLSFFSLSGHVYTCFLRIRVCHCQNRLTHAQAVFILVCCHSQFVFWCKSWLGAIENSNTVCSRNFAFASASLSLENLIIKSSFIRWGNPYCWKYYRLLCKAYILWFVFLFVCLFF